MQTKINIAIPDKLKPVFAGQADVRGAYGGRGSAKTRTFAKMAALRGMMFGVSGISGQILCARQYMNSLEDSSLEEIKRAIEDEAVLASFYEVGDKFVRSRDGKVWFSFAGLDRSINSIKSKGRILICWVDEAEPVTDAAWSVLIPTLREEGEGWNAELWVTWNPKRKNAGVETRFRGQNDPMIKVVELNWRDNLRFPAKLERERLRDFDLRPDQYEHIWEGGYITAISGAYYSRQLARARSENRICRVALDELMPIKAYWDIGGTGRKSDATAIWIVQFVGKEVRFIDYYEAVNQPQSAHTNWLKSNGYEMAHCILPHDGAHSDKIWVTTYEAEIQKAGFKTEIVPNQGAGAAIKRVDASRALFPQMWFDSERCAAGLDAIGWYHEKIDESRNVGLGPEHDWSSHGADAFGMVAVSYEQITTAFDTGRKLIYPNLGYG